MIELPLAPDEAVRFATALGEGASALNAELRRLREGGASAELIEIMESARNELDTQRLRIESRWSKPAPPTVPDEEQLFFDARFAREQKREGWDR